MFKPRVAMVLMVSVALVTVNPDICFSAGKGGGKQPKYIPIPQTGQTTSYAPGDDGALQKGVAWPIPGLLTMEMGQ